MSQIAYDIMEYLDVLDKDGNKTGEKKLRELVHRDGDWHRVVHVWIINSKKEILMQKRSLEKMNHPGEWDISCAGHVTADSDGVQTAIRETGEELGLDITESELTYLFSYQTQAVLHDGACRENELNDFYILHRDVKIEELRLQKEEVAEVKWFTAEDLRAILDENRPGYLIHKKEYEYLIEKFGN